MEENAKFEGWAVVELFGHQKETGHVTMQYFGGAAMFQIDIPELAEREIAVMRPGYVEGTWTPAGSVVRKAAVPARSRLVGPSAIYSLNLCTEEFARAVIDGESASLAVVSLAERKRIAPGMPDEDALDDDDRESSTGE